MNLKLILIIVVVGLATMVTSCKDDDVASPEHTVVFQPGESTGNDAAVWSSIPDSMIGHWTSLDVVTWSHTGTAQPDGSRRVFIQFDLSSIPVGATVKKASLNLYYHENASYTGKHSTQSGSNKTYIQMVNTGWSEKTINWSNQPEVNNSFSLSIGPTITGTEDFENLDILPMVEQWVKNPSINHGFRLRLEVERKYRGILLCGSEHLDPIKRPKLEIVYQE